MKIQLATSDHRRSLAKQADIPLVNRYFEADPVLTDDDVSLLARPGARRWIPCGPGPIRAEYDSPGAFSDALFVVSGGELHKVSAAGTDTLVGNITSGMGFVSMAATGNIGADPEFLFIADGSILWVYLEDGYARGTLTALGAIANGDQVRIGDVYYQFTSGSVDAGTPAGTAANPWLVALGASVAAALTNLFNAVNETGIAGTDYSTALVEHPDVTAYTATATEVWVRAKLFGTDGNTIVTTETGANLAWGAGTLTGGGSPSLTQVVMPDDVGAISVGYIGSFVIVVPAQGEGINGRFYWIEPGETTVDPLNFATAERSPDPIYQVVIFGDRFWLPGQSTNEVWYLTGDPDAPVLRQQGILFDSGVWEGTAVQVRDSMILVDAGGRVFQISGGIEQISTPQIEQRIRQAIERII